MSIVNIKYTDVVATLLKRFCLETSSGSLQDMNLLRNSKWF